MSASVSKIVMALVALYLVIVIVLGFSWSAAPAAFDVQERATARAEVMGREQVVGFVTTATLLEVADVLLYKEGGAFDGGYLSNDIFPPGVLLDNVPSWEFGVLVQVRDLARALRENLSRSQSQSTEDLDLAEAEPRYNYNSASWALAASETEYRVANKHVQNYLLKLSDPGQSNAQFYARADNLRYWLGSVEARLGSLSQRLSASVGQRRLNTDLAGDSASQQSTYKAGDLYIKTPWMELDDVFYEARGNAWALMHFLKAVEVDFAEVLENKNALVSLRQIIRELESTQEPIWSPMILNGGGFGLTANHSLVMASYISRANAAIIDLRELLAKG